MWSSAGPMSASVCRTVSSFESFIRIAMRTIGPEVAAAMRDGMPSRANGPAPSRKVVWSDLCRFSAHHEIVRGICWNTSSPQRSASSTAARRSGSAGNSGGSGCTTSSSREMLREPCTLRPSIFSAGTRLPGKPNSAHHHAADDGRQVDALVFDALVLEHRARRGGGMRPGDRVELDVHTGGLYSPNTSRITLQTSPIVARSRSASLIG